MHHSNSMKASNCWRVAALTLLLVGMTHVGAAEGAHSDYFDRVGDEFDFAEGDSVYYSGYYSPDEEEFYFVNNGDQIRVFDENGNLDRTIDVAPSEQRVVGIEKIEDTFYISIDNDGGSEGADGGGVFECGSSIDGCDTPDRVFDYDEYPDYFDSPSKSLVWDGSYVVVKVNFGSDDPSVVFIDKSDWSISHEESIDDRADGYGDFFYHPSTDEYLITNSEETVYFWEDDSFGDADYTLDIGSGDWRGLAWMPDSGYYRIADVDADEFVLFTAPEDNEPPEFDSVESDPSPPQIGENVSYNAELFDPHDDSQLSEVELELEYGGQTVYQESRVVSGDSDSAEWLDVFVPEETNEWLNATFTAEDTEGDTTEEELNYFLDDTPPEINIVQPENQTYWSYDTPYEIEIDSNNDAVPDQEFDLELYSDGVLIEEFSGTGTETFEGEFREDIGENIDFEAVANDTGGETTESTVFSVKALEFVSTGFQETVFETQENSYSAELDVGDMVEEIQVFLVYDGEQVVDDTTVFDSEIVYGHEETLSFRPGLVSSEEEVRDLYFSVSYVVEGFESGTEEKEIESSVEEQTVEKAFVPEPIDLSFDFGQSDRTVEKHSFDYILDYEDEGLSNDSISFEAETEFNNSVYTGFSGSITPGNVDGSADENVESDLLISFKGDEEIRSFETEVVTVDEVVLNTDGEGESVLAVELLDEEDNSAVESSVDFNFDTTTSQENLEKSFGFELDEVDSFDVYLDPVYAEVLVDGVFSYSSDGFRNRRYEVRNQEISSPALDLELYLIDDTVGEPVYFEVIDAAGDGVNGILETQRYSEASNSFRTVSRASIDDAESLAYLNIDDVYYRHQVRDNEGEVLRVFDRRLITCSTIPCERVLQISDDVIPFEEQRRGFDYTCSTLTDSEGGFNGVQCDVSHEDDIMQGADLKLERGRGLGTTTVCESSTSSPGQLICELDGEEDVEGYRYSYELKGHTNEYSYVLESGRFDFTDRLFQGQAPFLAVILFLSISLIGLRNYGTAVMFSVAGVFAGFAFGLLQVSAASVAGLFIVGLFYIFLHSRR